MKHAASWLALSMVPLACAHAPEAPPPQVTLGGTPGAPAIAIPAAVPEPPPALLAAPASARIETPARPAPAKEGPSCDGAPGAGRDCNEESCCLRLEVAGGDFDMKLDSGSGSARAHVASFAMDKYEVTVGRIRAWVRAGQPAPAEGEVLYDDGKRPPVRWPGKVALVQSEKQLAGWKRYDTWTGGEERRPKNSINWYTAAAFCRFDGGRLPTDAEWKYAAVGGDEQRPYPWGAEPPTPERAVYNCTGDGDKSCSLADLLPVGSRPLGAGRWGHMDLAGSVFEWTLNGATAEGAGGDEETSRGGGFCYIGGVDRRAQTGLRPLVFRKESASTQSHMVGARCAYDRK